MLLDNLVRILKQPLRGNVREVYRQIVFVDSFLQRFRVKVRARKLNVVVTHRFDFPKRLVYVALGLYKIPERIKLCTEFHASPPVLSA